MKANNSYSIELEAEEAAVTRFLEDLDIALGHDYYQRGRELFPDFPRDWEGAYHDERPLYVRLSRAFERLDESRKVIVKQLVQRALARCARFPLGLRRSLACIDIAHEISPDAANERLYSDLMLRPTNADERAEFLWQLIQRWSEWNVKVRSTPDNWVQATMEIAPKGILTLVRYFHAQNASDQRECWESLRRIALERITHEEEALLDVGQDTDLLRTQIVSLLLAGKHQGPALLSLVHEPSPEDEHQRLWDTLSPALRDLDHADQEAEVGWILDSGYDR